MKKKVTLILLICLLAVVAAAVTLLVVYGDTLFNVPTNETYTFINPDESRAETDEGMTVDGVLNEAVYSQNTWTYLHNANGGNTVDIALTSYFGEKGIYFAYEVRENTPIYVNMDRSSWMNSCIEMYLVPSDVKGMPSENVFEIDLLPTGYLLFKRPNAAGGWSDVSTTNDKMAFLGATTHGGEVNSDSCTGYNLELFIPYDYLEHLGVDPQLVKNGYVNVNPCHITSYNETGTDGSVDRFWYSFAKQLGGDGWNDINRYFKFNKDGAMGTVKNEFAETENCTISGNPTAIPGLDTTVTVTPDTGYALCSIACNGKELIQYVNYNEDGSAVITLPADNDGMRFTAKAEPITEGNKTLMGIVELQNIFGDTFEGVSASYEDASGQHKLELETDGSFILQDIPQGYYVIRVKKDGYLKAERTLCVNRDLEVVAELAYDLFETESGNCWNTDSANEGVLTKINGTGAILTKDLLDDFYMEANFSYSQELSEEFVGDDYQQQRMGFRVKFDNGKYWHIDLLRQNDGKYHLQFGKILGENSLFDWELVHELTEDQIARYQSEAGIKLGVLRTGKTAYIYLDNQFVGQADLGDAQAKCKAQVGFESFVANAKVMTVPYRLNVTSPATVELADSGCVGAKVSLAGNYQVGQDAVLLIQKTTSEAGAKLLSVQVNGQEMAHAVTEDAKSYRLVIPGNLEKILSVKVVYAEPSRTTAVIDTLDVGADGISVRLMQDGAVKATAVVNNGKAVFADIYTGVYEAQVKIFNIWTTLEHVTILDDDQVTADIKALFETPDNTNYTGTVTFQGTKTKHYSIATDIAGDAWFTMKLRLDKKQLDAAAKNKGNIRLGYRMFFGGYEGNYEWDNEYEITLKYTDDGRWVFEQMQTWESCEIPTEMVDALTAEGLYLALNRDADTGILTLCCGATEAQLLGNAYSCKWETASAKQKQNIKRFGVGFWSEKGSDYGAAVSDLRYGTSLSALLGVQTVNASLQLSGHKDGSYHLLPEGTQVRLESPVGEHTLMADGNGKVSGQVLPGAYSVCVDGYLAAQVEIPEAGLQGQLALEYDLFSIPTGWDADKHDLSGVNESSPQISMNTAGTMNVITNDSFGEVSASLWVKEDNSTHSAHTQGIWVRFEDGKYMILYQEDDKLLYMDKLWDFATVNGTGKEICCLPEKVLDQWKADGYGLTLLRKENRLYVTADGQLYDVTEIPAQYADDQVQVGFFAYDSAPGAAWRFAISQEIPPFSINCISSQNGTVTADKTSAQLGDTVTLRITPDAGYVLKSLKVNGAEHVDQVENGGLTLTAATDLTVEATFTANVVDARITANIPVGNGTAIRLLQDGQVKAEDVFTDSQVSIEGLQAGIYDAQLQVFGYWAQLGAWNLVGNPVEADVAALFEDPGFADFDGSISYSGTADQHCSVAAEITGDAWFTMKVQVDQEKLDAVAANKGNIRLGYRLFFGGETGNYLWENEYEPTLKYTAEGRWVMEQMNTWEGWDNYLSEDMIDALTGDGLNMALYRNAQTGELTLYYGATKAQLLSGAYRMQWTQATEKHKQTITRFGAGFWAENGADYTATVTNLRYGTSLAELMDTVDVTMSANADIPIRLTQNGSQCAVGTVENGQVLLQDVPKGTYRVEAKIFNTWSPITTITADDQQSFAVDVLSVFENSEFADLDGEIRFSGTATKHCSVAADISGDAWFAMKVQVDKAQLDAVAANKGNVRLGYRMFFGGEAGNYLWENEYEITLKYTQNGWILEQMNSWEGWDRTLSQEAVDAMTGDGLYLVMHRNAETGVVTLYYGATQDQILAGTHSFTYTQAIEKHKETITRFGAGFWSENGSDYTAAVTGLRYGATLEEALQAG